MSRVCGARTDMWACVILDCDCERVWVCRGCQFRALCGSLSELGLSGEGVKRERVVGAALLRRAVDGWASLSAWARVTLW